MPTERNDVFKIGDNFATLIGDEVKVGDAAPDFTSVVTGWGTVNPIEESKGKVIILCAVPFGIMGAILGLFGMGYDLSLFALFGVVDGELGKKIQTLVKQSKLKVQAAIQGDAVRITGGKRDDLQAAMALLRKDVADVPLAFNNFRD